NPEGILLVMRFINFGGDQMSEPAQDRRKHARKYFTVPICYKRTTESGEGTLAPVKDISEGGIGFMALEYIPPKTELMLKVFLPGFNEPIETPGKVIWAKKEEPYTDEYALFIIGVEFISLAEKYRKLITSFVSSL
ncbi:MAG: PilZ domain-containing protein, partial [bacterium]